MIIALLANPDSGDGDSRRVARLLREEGARVREFTPAQAEQAAASGAERIAIAGGDGSIAPAASAAGKAGIPVAVIATGTANDFVRAAGLPGDLDEACRLAVEGERRRAVDVARLGERPFVNVASAGLAPKAARKASGLKGALGPLAYLAGAVVAAARSRPVECALACDGEPLFSGEAWQAIVGCSGAFGAGSSIGGSPGDGQLRAVAMPAGSRLGLLRRARGLRRGDVAEQSGVAAARCREVDFRLPPGTELNVDGELVESGPVAVTIEPGAFELVIG